MVFRLNDNASAQWMSDRIGMVDRVVEAASVQVGTLGQTSRNLVTEPIIWPRELTELAPSEVVCTYRGISWRGLARAYYELWSVYRGKSPGPLRGEPYPTPPEPAGLHVVDAAE
jgi:hypothetical protein